MIGIRRTSRLAAVLLALGLLAACTPEIGSPAWCEDMKQKPKGDWSANELADFASHCLLQ